MKKSKKIIFLIILFLVLICVKTKVEATTITISPKSPKVGDIVTVTVTVTNVHTVNVVANVTGVVSGNIRVIGGDLAGRAKTYTESAKYKCENEGKISVSISSDSTAVLDGKYVKVDASESVNVEKKSSSDTTTTASSDATLKNLGIRPHDFSGFKKATTSYSVNVPNDTEKVSIYASATDSKATISGTGSKTLKVGKNTFNIKVTAADKKTTKTYTLNITRKDKQEETEKDQTTTSSDATLKNLGIRPKEYDFTGFKPGTFEYSTTVPNESSKINIYATASDPKATITGVGEQNLKEGKNVFDIKVTSSDKKETKTYKLTITRKEKEESEENETDEKEESGENGNKLKEGIKNIKVAGYTLSPEFNQEVYEYKLDVKGSKEKLDITTEKTSDDIEVEIAGNENLKVGENVITILSHNKKDDTTTTYQIFAKIGNQSIDLTEINKNIDEVQSNLNKQELIIKGTIVAIIVLIIVFLVQRYRLQQEDDDEDEAPYFEDEDENQDEYYNNIQETDNTSEVKQFYQDMEENTEYDETELSEKKKKYKGKRFK